MAISREADKIKNTNEALTPVGVPVAPVAPVTNTASPGSGSTPQKQFRSVGAKIGAEMTDEEKAFEGSKSGEVEFLACLGDPTRRRSRKQDQRDIPTFDVVGYRFKALADIKVPNAPLKPDFKHPTDVGELTWEDVKKGEEFYLTVFETGVFISQPQYAGILNGNGEEVRVSFTFARNRKDPLPQLQKASTTGSIKTNMIEIAEVVVGPNNRREGKVKDEYASKFAVLYTRRKAAKSGGASRPKTGQAQKELSRAFQAFIKDKYK